MRYHASKYTQKIIRQCEGDSHGNTHDKHGTLSYQYICQLSKQPFGDRRGFLLSLFVRIKHPLYRSGQLEFTLLHIQLLCVQILPLSELTRGLTIYPQLLVNVKVTSKKEVMEDADVLAAAKKVEEALGDDGRN